MNSPNTVATEPSAKQAPADRGAARAGAGGPALRRLLRAGLCVVLLWALFAWWLLGTSWAAVPGLPPPPRAQRTAALLARSAYAALIDVHPRPYIFQVDCASGGAVLVFGTEHTQDKHHPQLQQLQREWARFGPSVLLIEGRLGRMFPAFHDPVAMFGEMGFAHALARSANIPTYSWEPAPERVSQALINQGFSIEQVALRWILGPYFSNLRHGRPADPDAFVQDTLAQRAGYASAEHLFGSMTDVERAWRQFFPDGPDWRDVSDQFGLPGFLAQMDMNTARDEHLVAVVAELASRGERVLVAAGCSHAVVIEPAIRSLALP